LAYCTSRSAITAQTSNDDPSHSIGSASAQSPGSRVRPIARPRPRADQRVDRDARVELVPRGLSPLGVARDAELARRELLAQVRSPPAIHEHDLDVLALPRHHAPGRASRPDLATDDALDPRHDLGARRQRHRRGIEIGKTTEPERHGRTALYLRRERKRRPARARSRVTCPSQARRPDRRDPDRPARYLALVSNNEREFGPVAGLHIENWTA